MDDSSPSPAISGGSELGSRAHQEDAWLVARREGALLAVVCDGGGGGGISGRPAADLAATELSLAFAAGADANAIARTIETIDREIRKRNQAAKGNDIDPAGRWRWRNIVTTVDSVLFTPGLAHLAHVGDGRIYRCRDGAVEQLTMDHTLENERRRHPATAHQNKLSEPMKSILMRAVGAGAELEFVIDLHTINTVRGDIFILCSDGLYQSLDAPKLAEIAARGGADKELVQALLAAAAIAAPTPRGHDNRTVVVHTVGEDAI